MRMPHLPRQVRQRAPVDDSTPSPRRTRAAKRPPRPQAAEDPGAAGGAGGRRPAQATPVHGPPPAAGPARPRGDGPLPGRRGAHRPALHRASHDPAGRPAAQTRRTPGSGKAGLLRRPRPTLEVRRQGGEPGRTRPDRPHDRPSRRPGPRGVPPDFSPLRPTPSPASWSAGRSRAPPRTTPGASSKRSRPIGRSPRSIQVDGGSEFTARFERRCAERGPPLHVPPPGRPRWNGRVERCNDTPRLAFRALRVGELAVATLAEHQRWHNREGPLATLAALDMRSPGEHPAPLESTPSSA